MSYVTAPDKGAQSDAFRPLGFTFYEGKLSQKTGKISKTKVFGVILKNDASFYVVDQKLLGTDEPDRVNLYSTDVASGGSVNGQGVLLPGWTRYPLEKCQVQPSGGDKKCIKVIMSTESTEEQKSGSAGKDIEIRFYCSNVCARSAWIKKLLQAKNMSFEADDCSNVPLEEIMALQKDL